MSGWEHIPAGVVFDATGTTVFDASGKVDEFIPAEPRDTGPGPDTDPED